jgi:dihydrofolate reductase
MADKVKMPRIAMIVARSTPGHVIGRANGLPWHVKSDLQRFKALTTDHAIVMGRKTFESIGRPLPRRTTIVISRRHAHVGSPADEEGVLWAADSDAALLLADLVTIGRGRNMFFVIGGAEIYKLLLGRDLVDIVYLTEVFCDVEGDAILPQEFSDPHWMRREEMVVPAGPDDEFASRFIVYERREKVGRARDVATLSASKNNWHETFLRENAAAIEDYAVRNPSP